MRCVSILLNLSTLIFATNPPPPKLMQILRVLSSKKKEKTHNCLLASSQQNMLTQMQLRISVKPLPMDMCTICRLLDLHICPLQVQAKVLFRVNQSKDIALCCTWQTLISSNKRMGNILPGCLKLWLQ
jgi:hypothetical protein